MRSPGELASPEKRLLVACARTKVEPRVAQEIRELCSAPLDWDFVVENAAVNSILPLVARQVASVAGDIAPAHHVDRLNKAARANALRCLTLTAELVRIVDLLRAQSIQPIPYKGPVIAAQAYGDVALREFEDLDIVVRQRDMGKVDEVMKGLGYRPNHPWQFRSASRSSVVPGEYDYHDEARGLIAEFHTESTLRHFPAPPELEEMSRRLVPVMLSGHEIQTFAPEDMLVLLCVHGSKDFWARISWVADIAEFTQKQKVDWEGAFSGAEKLGATRMLGVGLALASKLLEAPLPQAVAERVQRDWIATATASEIVRQHLKREVPERGAGERFRFRRRMVAGSLAGWRYAARLATQPADEDSAAVELRGPLARLYPLLRPFRLLREYRTSSRGRGRPK